MELVKLINPQDELINSLYGIHLIDAGAGTGKTWTIIERYRKLVENNVLPKNILLITFTKNASNQMREEVMKKVSDLSGFLELLEAPVMTFHAYCMKLLKNFRNNSPSYLGLTEFLPFNYTVLEDRYLETEIFRRFCLNFVKKNRTKYRSIVEALDPDYEIVLSVIKKLCSVGIFPNSNGWESKDLEKLKGDFEKFSQMFDVINKKEYHKTQAGVEKNNELYKRFGELCKTKLHLHYERKNVLNDKSINPGIKEELFYDETQGELLEFISDIYLSYLKHLLEKNMINYEFV
ncbi:MAG: UvrD-helicase domain-containing protein, partial [Bacteroidota bacterium]|nr:UvrD-helicase domain-containing protein [Bacteroidota bacterium]